ncbi:MAG: HD domain-containing phosphohydrolase [Candidatus Omnitrophota bacterium]
MLKISDILKKVKKNKQTDKKVVFRTSKRTANLSEKKELEAVKPEINLDRLDQPVKKVIAKTNKRQNKNTTVESKEEKSALQEAYSNIYKEALILAKEIIVPVIFEDRGVFQKLEIIIDKLIDCLSTDEEALITLIWGDYFDPENYLYQHSVNVSILCLRLGLGLSCSGRKLKQIGIAAFFHDIGLTKFEKLITQPRIFNEYEQQKIKTHPVVGKKFFENIMHGFDFEIGDVIVQEHERVDGTGYPKGLKDKEILEYAKLIGLADTYEALMHNRPYRNKKTPQEAIKEIINHKAAYEHKFLKVFLNTFGVFPITTKVTLNTKEIGSVIRQNLNMPMRPVVNITHNVQGQELEKSKEIDLSTNFSVYIKGCFTETNLQ